jgi:hypothetical protein
MCLLACAAADVEGEPLARATGSCVARQTLRCLCGLDEGTQVCNDDGTLSACSCAARSSDALEGRGAAPTHERCGEEPLDVDARGTRQTGSLDGAKKDVELSCALDTARDHVWALRVRESGTLEVDVEGAFVGAVSARVGECTDARAERDCNPRLGGLRVAALKSGDVAFVTVAAVGAGGAYTLTARVLP